MSPSNDFSIFDDIYCISLKRNYERRKYICSLFSSLEISFKFVDACDYDSPRVTALIESGFVEQYPPCFRCGSLNCDCSNKSLFPPQVANWLSHMDAWQMVADSSARLCMICEDDIKFLDTHQLSLQMIASSGEIKAAIQSKKPLLLRLGWALSLDHQYTGAPFLSQEIRMSNPCYAVSPNMAALLLSNLKKIDRTSDMYIHRDVDKSVAHFTVHPPLAHDLSWSTGSFRSDIRPKEKYLQNLREQLEQSMPGTVAYNKIVDLIRAEEARMRSFEYFNRDPEHNSWNSE